MLLRDDLAEPHAIPGSSLSACTNMPRTAQPPATQSAARMVRTGWVGRRGGVGPRQDGVVSHVLINRQHWDVLADGYARHARRHWAQTEPTWGIFAVPQAQVPM